MIRVATGALLCAAVLLSGCQLDGDVDVSVDGNGGGTIAFTMAADEELLRTAADAGVDPLAQLEQAGAALDGWDATRHNADGGAAITLSTPFSDGTELQRITTEFSRALAAPELAPLGPLRLAVTDDTVTLDGTAGLVVRPQVSELGLTPDQAHERLAEAVDLRVVARMPGPILRSNADERADETTVVWTIEAGQRRTLEVAAERPWSLARVVLLIGGPYGAAAVLIGVLGVAGYVGYRWRQRRARGVDDADADDQDGGSAATGGAGADAPDAAAPDGGAAATGGARADAPGSAAPGDHPGADARVPDIDDADNPPGAAGEPGGDARAAAGAPGAGEPGGDADDDDRGDDAATTRPSRVRP